jgi:ATP-binding cassette subfamily B protein
VNDRWHAQFESARKLEYKARLKHFVVTKAASLVTALISLVVAGVLLGPVVRGQVSVGMFIGLVNAVFGLVQMMSWDLSYQVDQLAQSREYMRDLTAFAALEEEDSAASPPRAPAPEFQELELREVRFAYPGTEREVLKGLSLTIERGRHYAFVGVNGAGKTTITKLLTGLYRDFTGEILVNGRDIRSYAGDELRSIFSVVYQDFARYSIPFGEGIAIGNVNDRVSAASQARIARAIEDIGLDKTLAALPAGMKTPLGKIKDGGQDLSGGEWQRVALARALVSPAPVRILDEPTASLDPVSESKMYEMFENMSGGNTTLFISHRLGSTKLADVIFVISEGVVIEKGDHAALLQAGGVYAEMFESQREWYQ